MQNYRHGYPHIIDEDCTEKMLNLKFYLNEIKSSPDDVSIETFHNDWKADYKRLERVHSYIQWLFPLREPGVNYMATELTKKEIQAFRENEEAKSRLVESYVLMLGFYGIQLVDRDTGKVKRAENWRDRFANLERNMHNNLRITRILKSLGELGFEHYQAPLVRFFLEETLVKKTLSSIKRSVLDYFLFAVRDKRERRDLVCFAFQHFEPKDKFVWCPRRIQKRFKNAEKKPESPGRSLKRDEEDRTRCEGSSVDPEPESKGSPGVPSPLNNGGHADNGDMDDSSGSDTKIDDDDDYDDDDDDEGMKINPAKTSKDEASGSDQIANEEPSVSPKVPSSRKDVVLSPKHVLPSSPLPKRAEKLPRTDPELSLSDSGDAAPTSSPEERRNLETKPDEENVVPKDKGEPMDTESGAGGS
ncbi:opioid growth factor receptor isoform X2 [Trichomycterus rosablanca]